MKTWHKVLIGIAVYEVAAYAWNWAVPQGILPSTLPAAPLDLISMVFPQTISSQ